MSKKPNQARRDGGGCGGGTLACGAVVDERNRWFTGKFVTARAYRIEQEHFLSHRWLHNRMLHGWGVVHGLRVVPHPDPECAGRWVVVRCGMAIDCCGRELILRADTPVELPFPTGDEDEGGGHGGWKAGGRKHGGHDEDDHEDDDDEEYEPAPDEATEPLILCLRYAEVEIEPVPALQAEGSCDPQRSEASFVRQTAVVDVAPLSAFDEDCWRMAGGGEAKCRDDCDEELPAPSGSCLEPTCPCGTCVPLALIVPCDPDAGWEGGYEIDLDGRRKLPTPSDLLTHVAGINWPHGGELTLSELRDRGGRLEVRFDRKLRPADGDATGINEHTFMVQYGGIQQELEFLASNDEEGPVLEDDCRAVFTIDPTCLTGNRTIAGSVVYVTLKCDFILDCHGNPVDGEHLRGRLPSGDGGPGGTFESWFRVVADPAAKEKKKK
jgi:hypothetical protein